MNPTIAEIIEALTISVGHTQRCSVMLDRLAALPDDRRTAVRAALAGTLSDDMLSLIRENGDKRVADALAAAARRVEARLADARADQAALRGSAYTTGKVEGLLAALAAIKETPPVICGTTGPHGATCRLDAGHRGDHATARRDVTWEVGE